MSVHRAMGIETEFGILAPDNPSANAIAMSTATVGAYIGAPQSAARQATWDYAGEDPLSDMRGHRVTRAAADPSQLTDDPNAPAPGHSFARPTTQERAMPRVANAVLTSGARLYVDHAHPEYSAPEATTPRDVLRYDRAGEVVARRAMNRLVDLMSGSASPSEVGGAFGHGLGAHHIHPVTLYKNCVDGKGASYGTHENYLLDRSVDFDDVVRYLTPMFVTRQIYTGAGRVGLGQKSEMPGFQMSQRADYIENEVGLETTFNRPIINTRDEPHADRQQWRRLHVIVGDANLFDVPVVLKTGITALLLWLLENDAIPIELDTLVLDDPVAEFRNVSHDLTLTHKLTTRGGQHMTALDIQRTYRDVIAAAVDDAGGADPDTAEVLDLWTRVLDTLSTDISAAAPDVEWVAKYLLVDGLRQRVGGAWNNPRVVAFDLQWHDLRPDKSIVARLDSGDRITRLISDDDVAAAEHTPPETTRAFLRGMTVARWPGSISAAGWSSIVFDITERETLVRVPMINPYGGTRQRVGDLLDHCQGPGDLLDALTGGQS